MNINVTFESDDERFKMLSMISLTLSKPVTKIEDVESALIMHLEEVVKAAFISGGLKKVQLDNEAGLKEAADTFFKK